MRRRGGAGAALFAAGPSLFLVLPVPAGATQLEAVPALSASAQYSDNVVFTRGRREGDLWATVAPALRASASTERLTLRVEGSLTAVRYLENERLDGIRPEGRMAAEGQATERLHWDAAARYAEEQGIESEVVDVDARLVRSVRRRYGPEGGLAYRLDDRSQLGLRGSFTRTRYEGDPAADHDGSAQQVSYGRQVDGRGSRLSASLAHTRGRSDESRVDDWALTLGFSPVLTETWSAAVAAGPHRSVRESAPAGPGQGWERSTSWGFYGDASVGVRLESASAGLSYRRAQEFDADGRPVDVDTLSLTARASPAEHWEAGVTASASRRWSGGGGARQDTLYWAASPSLTWRFAEHHRLTAAYAYDADHDRLARGDRSAERSRLWLTATLSFPERW